MRLLVIVMTIVGGSAGAGEARAADWTQIDGGVPRSPVGVRTLVVDPSSASTVYALGYGSGYSYGNLFKSTDAGGSWSLIRRVSSVSALVIDPSDSSTMYATAHGMVLKSTDAGQSWTGASAGVVSAYNLAIDPRNTNTLYAVASSGIFKTTNGAASWKATGAVPACCGGQIAIDPSDSSTIYVNNGSGVLKSSDGGGHWRVVVSTPGGCNCPLAIDPTHPSTVYTVYFSSAGHQWDLFKTADGGESWSVANTGIPFGAFVTSLVVDPATATIYAGYIVGDPTGGVAKSTDGGASWSLTGLPPDAPPVHALALNPADPSTILAGYFDLYNGRGGVFRSGDKGANWRDASTGLAVVDVHAIAVDPVNQATVYVASGDGISKTIDNGGNWITVHFPAPGPGTAYVPSMVIDPKNPDVLYAGVGATGGCSFTDHFLRKSTDAGVSWSDLTPNYCFFGPGLPLVLDPSDSNTLYAAPEDVGDCGTPLQTTTDGGASWNQIYIDGFVTALVIDPANPATLYYGGSYGRNGVFKSTDRGKTWGSSALMGLDVTALAIDPTNSNILYAGTSAAYPDSTTALFKTTDGGATWSEMSAGLEQIIATRAPITAVAIDSKHSIIYLGTSGSGVFKSTDGGARWTAINDGLPSLDIRALAVTSDASGTVYAGTSAGVFRTGVNARPNRFRR